MENVIVDKKLTCCSIMKTMLVKDYLELVEKAYEGRGGIQGQREPLKQKTAITIRKRMINDIVEGTILPPVVVGVIVNPTCYEASKQAGDILKLIKENADSQVSIIDGMQRTTAILEAVERSKDVLENVIRVELWISCDINSMLYRMLVLNTGQVPWNMRRQIELIFDGITRQIEKKVPGIEIKSISDNQRRSRGGQYNAQDLIEMFLAYGARTWKFDTREKVTDEFTRGDFVQSTGDSNMVNSFCEIVELMSQIDIKLDEKIKGDKSESTDKFKKGKDLFTSQPAKIGFAAACGEYVMGRPGENWDSKRIDERYKELLSSLRTVISLIEDCSDIDSFMDFPTLSEIIAVKSSKVGDFEREKFYSSFKTLFSMKGIIDTFTVCWRAWA